jgi:hypothetical protein
MILRRRYGGEQTMPFDSKGLQFAHTSLNLPEQDDFNAAVLTAQDVPTQGDNGSNDRGCSLIHGLFAFSCKPLRG